MRRITLLWIFAFTFAIPAMAKATPTPIPTHGKFFSSNQRFFVDVRSDGTFKVFDSRNPGKIVWEFVRKNGFNTHYLVSDDGEVVVDLTLWNGDQQRDRLVDGTPTPDDICMTFIDRGGAFLERPVRDFYVAPANAKPRNYFFCVNPWFRQPLIQEDVFSFVTDEDRQFDISIKTGITLNEQRASLVRTSSPTRLLLSLGVFAVCVVAGLGLAMYGFWRKLRKFKIV